jgi:hypothetical protein
LLVLNHLLGPPCLHKLGIQLEGTRKPDCFFPVICLFLSWWTKTSALLVTTSVDGRHPSGHGADRGWLRLPSGSGTGSGLVGCVERLLCLGRNSLGRVDRDSVATAVWCMSVGRRGMAGRDRQKLGKPSVPSRTPTFANNKRSDDTAGRIRGGGRDRWQLNRIQVRQEAQMPISFPPASSSSSRQWAQQFHGGAPSGLCVSRLAPVE